MKDAIRGFRTVSDDSRKIGAANGPRARHAQCFVARMFEALASRRPKRMVT
jgi:hypothetical protein